MLERLQGPARPSSRWWYRCPRVLQGAGAHRRAKLFDRVDAYSAPRLVEYFDADPCARDMRSEWRWPPGGAGPRVAPSATGASASPSRPRYTVGEYDIVILSAKQSDGLETWLRRTATDPARAAAALQPLHPQDMKFFVAKVNLKEQARAASPTCGRSRSPTSRRSSCCPSASAWRTPRARRT